MSDSLFDICENRHRGNPESRRSFERVRDSLPEKRRRVLEIIKAFGPAGATGKEVAAYLGVEFNTISGRLSELKRDGMIVRTGQQRDSCAVYRA